MQCQKCLQMGHWTYECKNQKAYVQRESRSKALSCAREPVFSLDLPPGEKRTLTEAALEDISPKKKRARKRDSSSSSSSGERHGLQGSCLCQRIILNSFYQIQAVVPAALAAAAPAVVVPRAVVAAAVVAVRAPAAVVVVVAVGHPAAAVARTLAAADPLANKYIIYWKGSCLDDLVLKQCCARSESDRSDAMLLRPSYILIINI